VFRKVLVVFLFLVSAVVASPDRQSFSSDISNLEDAENSVSVTLVWDASTRVDTAGYRVYWGFSSRHYLFSRDVGNSMWITVSGLKESTNYYFTVTSYNSMGYESAYSNEVSLIAVEQTAVDESLWRSYR